ncbi:MAG: NAD(P)/FAD-dependent oxidoreductase [Akkermansiaceae bacterium]
MKEKITIIGGGLTGLSLAIGLRKNGVPVHLHEAGQYPRHRVCGEFISGISDATLNNLGIEEHLSDSARHTSVSWFAANEQIRDTTLPSPALAISRYKLDDRLQTHSLELGATIETSSRKQVKPNQAGFIKASGRLPARGKWIGLKAHIRDISTTAHLEMHSGPNGYLGVTPVEDGWHNVCGLFKVDRTISEQHEKLLPAYLRKNGNTALADRVESASWRVDSFSAIAGFDLGRQAPTPGILSLGDSHAIIPPFTGNGMTMAFQSAEIALPHLIDFASGEKTWKTAYNDIEASLKTRFRKRLSTASFLHPLLFRKHIASLLKITPISPVLGLIR